MGTKLVKTRRKSKGGKKPVPSIHMLERETPYVQEDLDGRSPMIYVGDPMDHKRFLPLFEEEGIESTLGDSEDLKALLKRSEDIWYLDTETYPDPDKLDIKSVTEDLITEKMKDKAEGKELNKTDKKNIEKAIAGLQKEYALDPRKNKIRLVQIKTEGFVYLVDLKYDPLFVDVLSGITERNICMQNAKFDMSVIYHHFGWEPKTIFDTMIANRIIEFARSKIRSLSDLGSIIERYTGIELPKDQGGSDWSGDLNPEQALYAYYDVEYLDYIAHTQIEMLNTVHCSKSKATGFPKLKNKVAIEEMEFTRTVAHMELRGIKLNKKALKKFAKEMEPEVEKLNKYFDKIDVNYNSHVQIKAYIIEKYDIELKKADQAHLKPHADKRDVQRILDAKRLNKKYNSIMSYLTTHNQGGFFHPSFNSLHAPTGRTSCYEPNVQQIDRTLKDVLYRPLKGYEVFRYDYPGEELRIAGEISQDPAMLKAFREGLDIHTYFASIIFKVPYDEVTKDQRQKAKSANFGLLYGMGVPGFISYAKKDFGIEYTLEEADEIRNAFFATYKKWKSYHTDISNMINVHGFGVLETLYGRLSYQDQFTNAVNLRVQGTASDVIKIAMNRIHKDFKKKDLQSHMISMVHDEIVFQIHKDETEVADKIIRKRMEKSLNNIIRSFSTRVEGELIK